MKIENLGFRTDVVLRVLEGAQVTDGGDYLAIHSADNPTFWWGNFLLLEKPPEAGTAATWLARFAAEFPEARHVTLGVDGPGDNWLVPADFPAAGLRAQREIVLTCTVVNAPAHPPVTAEIRPLTSDADWQQSLALAVRCADPGAAQDAEYLTRRTAVRRRLTQEGGGAWFGAFHNGRLLSQLGIFDVGDGFARYQHVETDPGARRRGLAGTLIWQAGRYARETLGAMTLVIVADPAEAAIRVYKAVGFSEAQGQLSCERAPAG